MTSTRNQVPSCLTQCFLSYTSTASSMYQIDVTTESFDRTVFCMLSVLWNTYMCETIPYTDTFLQTVLNFHQSSGVIIAGSAKPWWTLT